MIIIAILVVIAVIAVPNLLNHAQHANEFCTVATLRRIANVQKKYRAKHGVYGTLIQLHNEYPMEISRVLGEATSPSHPYSGYFYTITLDGGSYWCCVARPTIWDKRNGGATGAKNFMVGKDGVVYYNTEEGSSDFTKKVSE